MGLRDNVQCSPGLIGKRVVDFLLVIIELLSLAVTAEALRTKIDRKSAISLQLGHTDPKISGRRGRSPPIIFASIVRPCLLYTSDAADE